jgi:hypothetical protein
MSAKHEEMKSENIYYCFVGFETEPPGCWIVPSPVVADVLKRSHANWLSQPGKRGRPHRDSNMRRFCESYDHEKFSTGFSMDGWMNIGIGGICLRRLPKNSLLSLVSKAAPVLD